MDRQTDGWTDTGKYTIIPHHYCVVGYKNIAEYRDRTVNTKPNVHELHHFGSHTINLELRTHHKFFSVSPLKTGIK